MSGYVPVKGDRVRVTFEGVVRLVEDGDYFDVDGIAFGFEDPSVSVEKITPPLPTARTSVIVCHTIGARYFLTDKGWIGESGFATRAADLAVCAGPHEVIFDAGAS